MLTPKLIEEAQQGDREALKKLLQKIETPLYRTAFYMLGHEQDALDATQESLLKIYKNVHRFEHKAHFMTWAQRIASNVCIDHLRKRKETVSVDEHDYVLHEQGEDHVQKEMERKTTAEDVHRAMAGLPLHLRQVLIFRYMQDMTYEEIAHTLESPLNTVKSHLFRARKQLQNLLQNEWKGGGC